MHTMHTIKITATGQTSGGKPLDVGTIIKDPLAWIHCIPGFRNAKPIAEPVGTVTQNKVAAELKKHGAKVDASRDATQAEVDRLAKVYKLDDSGDFLRTEGGSLVRRKGGKVNTADQAQADNAEAYGITPQVADDTK